eukprot:6340506-Ditylum_brightwellii.AAC.1
MPSEYNEDVTNNQNSTPTHAVHGRLCWMLFGFTMMYDMLTFVRAGGHDPYFAADHSHRDAALVLKLRM